MYNSDTELLFPLRVIPSLGTLRGEKWQNLIHEIMSPSSKLSDQMGFTLLMVRLDGCIGCNADSYRAMKGCTQCARQNIRRFRGTDQDLIELYHQARKEAEAFLEKRMLEL